MRHRSILVAFVLALCTAAASAADRYERFLDPSLKLLYRAQTSEGRMSQSRAREAMDRLNGIDPSRRNRQPDRLSLVVKFPGDPQRLEDVGFVVDSCVGPICSGSLPVARLPELAKLSGIHRVELSRRLGASAPPPASSASATDAGTDTATADHTKDAGGTGVLVAFIDTGVDIFHSDFVDDLGNTRIKVLLDLSDPGDTDGDGVLDGDGPYGGTLYSEADINAALAAGSFAEADIAGHGTHGLSVAAGDDPGLPGMAPTADLIVVKATREHGTLGFYSADLINGLAFVDEQAELLGQPYVVNLSLGSTFCSHDGRSLEEQAVDALAGPGVPGKVAVIAAGNSSANRSAQYKHLSDTAFVGLDASHTLTVPTYTSNPGSGSDRILLDLWYEGRDELTITVTGPADCGSPQVTAEFGTFSDTATPCGDVFIANMGGASPLNGDIESIILIDDWSGTEPAEGDWTLTVMGEAIGDSGVYHGWLADESVVGSTTPFLSANADNAYLVGKPGGAYHGITVGSYGLHDPGTRFLTEWDDVNALHRVDTSAVDGDISEFSSPGPTRDGRVKPELAAPGERVMGAVSRDALPGSAHSIFNYHTWYPAEPDALLVDDTADAAFGMLQGTSFAAPVVSGLAARILGEDPALDAIQVRNILLNTGMTDVFTGPVPSDEWGYGKADVSVGSSAPLPPDLRITVDALPDGYVNVQYNHVLTASGGTLPYRWFVTGGTVPPGLTLGEGGLLTGKPTAAGAYLVTVEVTDGSAPAQVRSAELGMTVGAVPPLRITTRNHPVARLGELYESRMTAEAGVPPYFWSIAAGDLPPGLGMNGDGIISGVPSTIGRWWFSVRVEDSGSASELRSTSVSVVTGLGADWGALGKSGPSVVDIVVDPTDPAHIAATETTVGAVFESLDFGQSWNPMSVNNGLNTAPVHLAFSPTLANLWAVTESVVESGGYPVTARHDFEFDPGTRAWIDRSPASWCLPTSSRIGFDSLDRALVFCQTSSHLFYREDGAGWISPGPVCGNTYWQTRSTLGLAQGTRSNADQLYLTRSGRVYPTYATESLTCASLDGGATWADVTNGSSALRFLEVSSEAPFDVVKGDAAASVFFEHSVDGGRNWNSVAVAAATLNGLRRSATEPSLLLAGTDDGLYRSTDHGATWERVAVPGGEPVSAVEIDPSDDRVFLVATPTGVHRSIDAGVSWATVNQGLVVRPLGGVAVARSERGRVVVSSSDGPYLSQESGDRWTLSRFGISSNHLVATQVAVSPVDQDRMWLGGTDGVYRSSNGGVTWQVWEDPTSGDGDLTTSISASPFAAGSVAVGLTGSKGIYRSLDGGESWEGIGLGLPLSEPTDLAWASDVPDRLFASFVTGEIFRSDDAGSSWTQLGDLGATCTAMAPAMLDSERVVAAAGSTMYYRPGSGGLLPASANPLSSILALAADPLNVMVAYAGGDHPGTVGGVGGFYRTHDGGQTWTHLPGVLDSFDVVAIASHPSEPGILWAATDLGGVYRSVDGGVTWALLANYGTIADLTNVNVQDPSNEFLLFAGTEGYGVQASVDGGKTFAPRVDGLTNYFINALAFDPDDPTILFAGSDSGVFTSTDSGTTWLPTSLTSGEVEDMVTDNEGTARRIWATVAGEGVAYSEDGGVTFNTYSSGLASLELTSLDVEYLEGSARRIWATTRGGDGVVFSDDLGHSWRSASGNGLTDRQVNDLAIDGAARRIWATTDLGVFYSDNEGLSWSELSLGLPSGIPVTSVAVDPNTGEALVSLYSEDGGGVYRGGNISGLWREFSAGLDELKVKKLTNDNGHAIDATTLGTTFYASTRGDGVYRTTLRFEQDDPPAVATSSVPDALLRMAYTEALSATGGSEPYAWNLHAGALPPGLRLDAGTGEISGEPGQVGRYDFTVQVSDANAQIGRRELSIEVLPPDELVVLECTPAGGARGQSLPVSVSGAQLVDGASVELGAGVSVVATTWISEYELIVNLSIAADAAPGWRSVTVTNPDLSSASLENGFKVEYPTPVVSGVAPTAGSRTTSLDLTITGQYFEDGAAVDLGDGVGVNTVTRLGSGELAVNVSIAADSPLGTHTVSVTNPSGFTGSLADAFEVLPAPPTVGSVSPSQGNQGATLPVTVYGTDFASGVAADFGAGITVDSTSFVSATQLTANVSIAGGTALGKRSVTVSNPDGQSGSLADAFNVMGPPPQILGLSPSRGNRGATLEVSVTGNNLQQGVSADFGAGVTVNSTNHISSALVTVNLTIDPVAALGSRDVRLINADGQSATWSAAFEITAPPPDLGDVTPASGRRGDSMTQTLSGNGFLDGATVSLGEGITVQPASVVSANELHADISIAADAALGARSVTVSNPDGQSDVLVDGFEVIAQAPLVSSVDPLHADACSIMQVLVRGAFFQEGAAVDLGPDLEVLGVAFDSSSRLTVDVAVGGRAQSVPRDAVVTNPDGQSGMLAAAFAVDTPVYTATPWDFAWLDSAGGADAGVVGDDGFATVDIGFGFPYFGLRYSTVTVSANGYLSLGGAGDVFLNTPLPDPSAPANVVAVLWDDLDASTPGLVTTELRGEAPTRRLVVQWTDVPRAIGGTSPVSFQAVLHEESGAILLQYLDTDFGNPDYDSGASASAGLGNHDGTDGVQVAYDEPLLDSGTAFLLSTPACHADLSVEQSDDVDPVAPGAALSYAITVSNTGPSRATGVALVDTLPPAVSFVSALPSQGSCDELDGVVACALGALASGSSATVDVAVTVSESASGSLDNLATASCLHVDPTTADASDSELTEVLGAGPIFEDDFETGDTSRWSTAVP